MDGDRLQKQKSNPQLPTKTPTTPTTPITPFTTTLPKSSFKCPFVYQAVMNLGPTYIGFKNDEMHEIDSNGHLTGSVKKISSVYPGINSVDAAAYSPTLNRVYLIIGSQLHTYTNNVEDTNSPTSLSVKPVAAAINGDILTLLLPDSIYLELYSATLKSKANGVIPNYGNVVAAVGTKDTLDIYTENKKIMMTMTETKFLTC